MGELSTMTLRLDATDVIEYLDGLLQWTKCYDAMPPDETPVLVRFASGKIRIAELRWDHPGHEDTYNSFQYWDDPENDGQDWQLEDVVEWKYFV